MKYTLYTDGATSNNGDADAQGGWGWALFDELQTVLMTGSGHMDAATNNKCEMTAIIKGCEYVSKELSAEDTVTICSDSAYCINCYIKKWYVKWKQNGWRTAKRESVANKELWQELLPFFEDTRLDFTKVKGHSSDKRNDLVDSLAVAAKFQK